MLCLQVAFTLTASLKHPAGASSSALSVGSLTLLGLGLINTSATPILIWRNAKRSKIRCLGVANIVRVRLLKREPDHIPKGAAVNVVSWLTSS